MKQNGLNSILFFMAISSLCIAEQTQYEIAIPNRYFVNTRVSSIPELRHDHTCYIHPLEIDPSQAVLHCFPTVDFIKQKIYYARYISCDTLPPGEVLLGIIKNPNPNRESPYCFIWAWPPSKLDPFLTKQDQSEKPRVKNPISK